MCKNIFSFSSYLPFFTRNISCPYLIRQKVFLLSYVGISSLSYFIVPRMGWEQICDRLKRLFERAAHRLRFITRADEIYFLGKQMNTKTNFRRPSMARWFALVFQFSARRRRRDVIVKYNYSVSRRLFLTPGSSPSLSLVLATVWSTNNRSVSSWGRSNPITPTLEQRYRGNPASWLKYPACAVFPRDFSLAADCSRNFPRVSRALVNISFLWSTTNITFRTQRAILAANPIELERNPFPPICSPFYSVICGTSGTA